MTAREHVRKCCEYIGTPLADINRAELLYVTPITRDGIIVDIGAYCRSPLYLPHVYYHSMDIREIVDEEEIDRVYKLYRELMGKRFTDVKDIFAAFTRHNINIRILDIAGRGELCQIANYMYDRYTITVNKNGFICDIERG